MAAAQAAPSSCRRNKRDGVRTPSTKRGSGPCCCHGTFWFDGAKSLLWSLARSPHLLETSLPAIFAVGDVRAGNIKRVASAVGEGAIAVQLAHEYLAEQPT